MASTDKIFLIAAASLLDCLLAGATEAHSALKVLGSNLFTPLGSVTRIHAILGAGLSAQLLVG